MADELWCLHVLGPDDLHPAPSKEAAERAAEHLSRYYGGKQMDPPISFEAKLWPYSAESHAQDVRFFYAITGTFVPVTARHATMMMSGAERATIKDRIYPLPRRPCATILQVPFKYWVPEGWATRKGGI